MRADSLAVRPRAAALPAVSALAAFAAGALAPFTVAMVGEEPIGEIVLAAVAAWALACAALRHAWPGPLLRSRLCRSLLAADTAALLAYVASDLYRRSHPHDYLRGWSRVLFVGVDVVAVAYLFGRSPRNLAWFLTGACLGGFAHAGLIPPLFGDQWKFGFAVPISLAGFLGFPLGGAPAAAAGALGLGALNFARDYRSEGGICVLTGIFTLLQLCPRRGRLWLAPPLAVAAAALVLGLYSRTENVAHADRSDLERQAMMTVAAQAFLRSPLIGHGSWFSNTDVYQRFIALRASLAEAEQVPGFGTANSAPGDLAFHSQILVALAEGGIVGGAFFIVYGAALLVALVRLVFAEPWSRIAPAVTYLLISSFWDLIFSPFSGEQRITVALTCGAILLVLQPGGLAGAFGRRRP